MGSGITAGSDRHDTLSALVTSPPDDTGRPRNMSDPGDAAPRVQHGSGAPEPPEPAELLGEMLIRHRLVTREQVDEAFRGQAASGLRLGTMLVELGAISDRQLVETLSEQLGLPVAALHVALPAAEAVARLPEHLARLHEIVPVRLTAAGLEVAIADMLDPVELKALEASAGCPIKQVLAAPSEIRWAIDRAYVAIDGVEQHVQAFENLASSRAKPGGHTQLEVDEHAPVVQVVMLLLTQAIRDRASDIHLRPQESTLQVRFRVDGALRDVTTIPIGMAQALISRIKVMADMNIVERRRSQDGQISTSIDGRAVDIRVATTSTIWGEKAVLRLLDKTRSLRTRSELGMSADVGAAFSRLVASPFGMVLCTGPTGSGKTTTLYAALNELADPSRNITTIEDPVEYLFPSIDQIQVNNQAGITFADGLKSILRQDPDVILVGEIRDVETARIAVQSALTGHLVLSSLHATDAATALQRLREMGIEPYLIASAAIAVVAQRLVRRICEHCKQPNEPTANERAFFEHATGKVKELFWHGVGCNLCSGTGYSERIGVYELLRVTEQIKRLVVADAGHEEIRGAAVSQGMRTLRDEGIRLVEADITTVAEVIRSVYIR